MAAKQDSTFELLVTCNFEWDDQESFFNETDAHEWMLAHAKKTGHDKFRVWYYMEDSRVHTVTTVESKPALGEGGWR